MIQIDMQIPEACDVCPFNYDFCWCKAFGDHDNWEKYSDDWNENVCERTTRPEYCPLKEQETKFIWNLLGGKPYEVYCKECRNIVCQLCEGETMNQVKSIFSYCPHCGRLVKWSE